MVSASAAMSETERPRKFLVVVDKGHRRLQGRMRFAARRAPLPAGRVTLLCVAQPADFQQWRGVEEIMKDEAHQEAEALIYAAAKTVNELAGIIPELVIAEGRPAEALLELVKSDSDISILVSPPRAPPEEGPGPLVSLFAGGVQAIPDAPSSPATSTEEKNQRVGVAQQLEIVPFFCSCTAYS